MKYPSLTFICTFAIAAISFQSIGIQSVDAQEKMFGNGRFLKRVFNDLVPQSASSKLPTPVPAVKKVKEQPKSQQPTPVRRPSLGTKPSLANQAVRPRTADPRSIQPDRTEVNRAAVNRLPKSTAVADADGLPTRSSAKATLGFGMLVTTRNEKLYVAQLAPKGNAATAGVRIGDRLVAGGGIEFESLADYNGVGDILEDGDQLEFELERGGREKEMMIVYGKATEDQAAMMQESFEEKPTPETTQRRSLLAPKVNQINIRDNNSFMPTQQNVQVRQRNQSFSSYQQQTAQRGGKPQTIGSQQGGMITAPSLQLPALAESVLN